MPGRDHLPSSMQERSSFKTEFQALPGEKEPREETDPGQEPQCQRCLLKRRGISHH